MKFLGVDTFAGGGRGNAPIAGQLYVYIIASTAGGEQATRSNVVDGNEICQPF